MSSYNLQAYKVIDPMTYDAHAQIVLDKVPSRIFEGNSLNYSPGTAETTEKNDISFGFFSNKSYKVPKPYMFSDYLDAKNVLLNFSSIRNYPRIMEGYLNSIMFNATSNINGSNFNSSFGSPIFYNFTNASYVSYNATNIASLNGSNSTDITTNYTLASVLAKSDLFSNNSVFSYTFSLLEHYRNELILIPEVIGFSVPMVVPVNGLLMGLSYDITNETDIRVVYGAGLRNNSLWVIENMQTRDFGSKYDAGDEFRLHIQKDGTVDYFLNEDLLYSSKSHIENEYKLFVSMRQQNIVGPARIRYFSSKSFRKEPCNSNNFYSRDWVSIYDETMQEAAFDANRWTNNKTQQISAHTLAHGIFLFSDPQSMNVLDRSCHFPRISKSVLHLLFTR